MKSTECMLCWSMDSKNKDIKVVPWPDSQRLSLEYCTVGACMTGFNKMPPNERALALITEGLYLAEKERFPLERVFAALMEIDECRDAINKDWFGELMHIISP